MKIKPGILTITIIPLIVLSLSSVVYSAINYPYLDAKIKYPTPTDPYAGYGTMHSALATNISTALWNPAGITNVPTGEITVLFNQNAPSITGSYSTNLEEQSINFGDNSAGFNLNLFYSHTDTATVATQEIIATGRYDTESLNVSYGQIVKFNDYLSLGMMTQGNTAANLIINGQFPFAAVLNLDMYAASDSLGSGITINHDGTVTISTESFSYTSDNALWDGFLNQSSTVAATSYTNLVNNFSINPEIVMTGASQLGPFSFGINIIPISASSVINNVTQVIIKDDATDIAYYLPDVDISNEADVVQWLSDPDVYGTENGYNKDTIGIPAGEVVADATYQGFYAGSTTRVDIGTTYDLSDILTISIVAENFNGATLNMQGSGIVAYGTHRLNTAETPSYNVTTGIDWSPFTDTEQNIAGSEDWAPAESINLPLPKRMRYGVALRKPFLISFDYEQQLTPIEYASDQGSGTVTTKISGINILRIGLETRVLLLPLWIRGSTALVLKPTITNNLDLASSINSLYSSLPVLPAALDLGGNARLFDTDAGLSFGFNALTFLSLLQADTVNNNLAKLIYASAYGARGPWKITYTQALDPIATATTYLARTGVNNINLSNFQYSDLKWLSTLAISYKF